MQEKAIDSSASGAKVAATEEPVVNDAGGPSEITTKIEEASRLKRTAQMIGGVVLVVVGVILSGPGIPGPGVLFIVVGLNLIKPDNRLSRWLRRKAPGIPSEGAIPVKQMVIYILITIAFVAVSILFGPKILQWGLDTLGLDITLPF